MLVFDIKLPKNIKIGGQDKINMVHNSAPGGPAFPYDAYCFLKSDTKFPVIILSVSNLPNTMPPPSRFVRRAKATYFRFEPLGPSGPMEEL